MLSKTGPILNDLSLAMRLTELTHRCDLPFRTDIHNNGLFMLNIVRSLRLGVPRASLLACDCLRMAFDCRQSYMHQNVIV